jgi:hypothetical protein
MLARHAVSGSDLLLKVTPPRLKRPPVTRSRLVSTAKAFAIEDASSFAPPLASARLPR